MQLHNLSGKKQTKKRVGRGGKRGTYSGRGGKGQTARAGHRIRPAIRDYLKQIPKRRGRHKHSFKSVQTDFAEVHVSDLEHIYNDGEIINPKTLIRKGLVCVFNPRRMRVKVLGGGSVTKRFFIKSCTASAGAKKAIEAAGGTIEK